MWTDENETDLGEVPLTKAHQEGLLHRIAAVYLTNKSGQILVQKREDGWLDHSVGGHVELGETYDQAAHREMSEEVGVSGVILDEIGYCASSEFGGRVRHKFKVFRCQAEPGKIDPSEVLGVYWADPEEIWQDIQNDSQDKKYTGGFKVTLKLFLGK